MHLLVLVVCMDVSQYKTFLKTSCRVLEYLQPHTSNSTSQTPVNVPGQWSGMSALRPYLSTHTITNLNFFLVCRSLAHDWWRWRERKKRMNKEREKMVRGGAASYVAEYPGASASPHILPIFKMDMRIRRQPRRTWMIRGVRLGRVFSSLSCPVTDQTRPRAYERWFEVSGCRCSNIVVQLHTRV